MEPTPGKIAYQGFDGPFPAVLDEVNAFLDGHDLQRYPVNNITTNFHMVGEAQWLSVLILITAPLGTGRPQITVPKPVNGGGRIVH